jgi:hypothetical protein
MALHLSVPIAKEEAFGVLGIHMGNSVAIPQNLDTAGDGAEDRAESDEAKKKAAHSEQTPRNASRGETAWRKCQNMKPLV